MLAEEFTHKYDGNQMSSLKEDLERSKLRNEIYKLQADTDKSRAELRQIRSEKKSRVWTSLSSWLPIVSLIATIIYGIFDFLHQQRMRNEFQITKEVIQLVNQLGSANEVETQNAAILLTSLKEHAVPILFSNLNVKEPSFISQSAEKALGLLAAKDPNLVIPKLLNQTPYLFESVIKGEKTHLPSLLNHLRTTGNLGAIHNPSDTLPMLKVFSTKLKCQDTNNGISLPVSDKHRKAICVLVRKGCERMRETC